MHNCKAKQNVNSKRNSVLFILLESDTYDIAHIHKEFPISMNTYLTFVKMIGKFISNLKISFMGFVTFRFQRSLVSSCENIQNNVHMWIVEKHSRGFLCIIWETKLQDKARLQWRLWWDRNDLQTGPFLRCRLFIRPVFSCHGPFAIYFTCTEFNSSQGLGSSRVLFNNNTWKEVKHYWTASRKRRRMN